MDFNERQILELEKSMRRGLVERFKTAFSSVDANIRARLLKRGGEAGSHAVMMRDLIAGATPKAQDFYVDNFELGVFRGLTRSGERALDHFITAQRIAQIDMIRGEGSVKHVKGVTGSDALEFVRKVERADPKLAEDLHRRADMFFAKSNRLLSMLHREGIITDALFNKLKNFDYRQRQLLEQIDPTHTVQLGGRKITVTDSGIRHLEKGSGGAEILSARDLAAQLAGRVMNRIARNKANEALAEVGKIENNGLVRLPDPANVAANRNRDGTVGQLKTPKGFVRLDYIKGGQQQPIFVNSKYAQEWIGTNPTMTRFQANFLRSVSGSALVRPLATGFNPEFIITNFPRDIVHIWLTTSQYSNHLPIYGLQLARDLITVAPDTFLRRGRWKDYIDEGGGMSFLAHQGRDLFVGERGAFSELSPKLRKTKAVLGYLNETSEIWTRLALRERALRNGKNPTEATWEARNYLDFAQGGTVSKGIDHFVPYFNASIQAFRGVLRRAREAPGEVAYKGAQLMALAAYQHYNNRMANDDTMQGISQKIKDESFIVPVGLPPIVDRLGNVRHLYVTIKKDNNIVPFTMFAEMLMDRVIDGKPPDRSKWETFRDAVRSGLPIIPTSIPIMDAIGTYASNYDMWLDDKVWRGPNVPPEEEFLT
ncbi:MAG: hypothetical protein NWE76_06695, partial [Candidatus Bathyarchaeota archaeon]|nr:hypothetical protein [Candidatus Bathyarchaeota archaeon]